MNWAGVLWALFWPPAYTFSCAAFLRLYRRQAWRVAMRRWFGRWLAACIGVEVSGVLAADPLECAIAAALAAGGLALWWWLRRKHKDRAPRMHGHKARTALAALVRKAREAARPRPVLRPAPGGAS